MQISARYQAVFELLQEILKDKNPADAIINNYMRSRKYIGAKDRRFICDTTWHIIRNRLKLEFDAKSSDPRKILLYYLRNEDFDIICSGNYGITPLSPDEKKWLKKEAMTPYPPYVEHECPKWLFEIINNQALVSSLNSKASIDIRAHFISPQELKKRLEAEGLFFSFMPYSPVGLRSAERLNLNNCIAYQEGYFDLQDEACQVAALLCDVQKDEKIIDYCAGAGGKSLALSAILENEGTIYAHDISWHRMDPIKERAQRLHSHNIKLLERLTDQDYDCFIVDSPCSGSGVWRRSPDAKFRLKPQHLQELNAVQKDILETAYKHTKSGGRIIYMTCSILKSENEDIIEAFLQKHTDTHCDNHENLWKKKIDAPYPFKSKDYLQFSPLSTNTDGFFFCCLRKT